MEPICDIRGIRIFEMLGNNPTMHNVAKGLLEIIQIQIKSPIKNSHSAQNSKRGLVSFSKDNKRNKEKQRSIKASLVI